MTDLIYDHTGSGDPLVFLHGLGCSRHHWDPVAERLTDRYRCFKVDLVGHGDSPRSGPADLFGQVVAITGLLDELGLDQPVLVGHSFGGSIATVTAGARPLRGVVNVDNPFDPAGAIPDLLLSFERRLRGDDFDAAFAEIMEHLGLDLVPAERQRLVRDNIRPQRDVVLETWNLTFDTPREEVAELIRAGLATVAAPYLGIFGAPLSEQERGLQALIPQSTVEVWDGHGHWLHLVDPDRTAARIDAFASSLP
jgi:pimeloyl-ACP methyl ester carboxylesterase